MKGRPYGDELLLDQTAICDAMERFEYKPLVQRVSMMSLMEPESDDDDLGSKLNIISASSFDALSRTIESDFFAEDKRRRRAAEQSDQQLVKEGLKFVSDWLFVNGQRIENKPIDIAVDDPTGDAYAAKALYRQSSSIEDALKCSVDLEQLAGETFFSLFDSPASHEGVVKKNECTLLHHLPGW